MAKRHKLIRFFDVKTQAAVVTWRAMSLPEDNNIFYKMFKKGVKLFKKFH